MSSAASDLDRRLCLQLSEQVRSINSKLQASIATLSQTGSNGATNAASGKSSGSEGAAAAASRAKIDKMSAEVVDSNPYSRLMALQRMGIVKDYERIRTKTVGYLSMLVAGRICVDGFAADSKEYHGHNSSWST